MPWWIWIILGAVLLGAEMLISADFYLVFFGVSGLLMGLAMLMGLSIPAWAQWLIFATVATVLLVFYRGRLKNVLSKPDQALDREIVDEIGVVVDSIAAGAEGKIELRGTSWGARNIGDRDLQPGERAKVIEQNGLLLHVRSDP